MHRVTVTLDDELMGELDRVMAARGYQNRSEAIRDLARAGLRQANIEAGASARCVGVLSYVYDHAARDLARRLTSAFHDHHDLTVSSMHVHLDHDNCLEVSVLKGPTAEVQRFAESVIAERSVRHGEVVLIPADEAHEHGHGEHPHHHHHQDGETG
ncbi:nickel-responsive transcriptional regulator NikR [Arsenicitalea aurantiaca]|uniref:Putative nickel-responsive regulator n=1 Tax=Arsenicitalea aurantiaca TaxID=1783274 RepID=A0A433XM44_9HYPH|nr:nickel-responsive transcriptional regulator NikR [Arsenicitalea aurantiaca]RUT35149.1 nickel-responsive transcriptional regulator NikR [Arsenicitalea aurantiaca]